MITIITENPRSAKAIAKAFDATPGKVNGIFNSNDLTVIAVPQDFLTPRKLDINTLGKLPYIPSTYNLRQNRSKSPRGFEGAARKAILASEEIVFASASGADAQARFYNICRHYGVGQKTSRMWLKSHRRSDIAPAFAARESGRQLHRLAQTGLVSMAMESAFGDNFNNALHHIGFQNLSLSRREVIVLDFLRSIDEHIDESFKSESTFKLCLNPGTGMGMMSKQSWATREEAEVVLKSLNIPTVIPVEMEINIDSDKQPNLFTTTSLQIEAFRKLRMFPARTMSTARSLFNRGVITSPYTHKPTITTVANPVASMTRAEHRLYQLIRDRKNMANKEHDIKAGKIYYSTDGVDFHHTLLASTVQNLPLGTVLCGEPFIEAVVREVAPCPSITYDLADILSTLTKELTEPKMPFRAEGDDYGSVISSLISKNLVKECEGMIFLSETGEDIMDNIGRLYPGSNLVAFQFDADGLTVGIGTGKQCIADFSDWLYSFTSGLLDGKNIDGEYAGTVCPVCGAHAIYNANHTIRCAECDYHISDTYFGKTLTPELTRQLLTHFHTSEVKGLQTKEGKRFSSVLALDANYQPTLVKVPDTDTYRVAV